MSLYSLSSSHDITMLGVKEALRRFNLLSIPFSRPPDFYAEMLKTDNHMHKVRFVGATIAGDIMVFVLGKATPGGPRAAHQGCGKSKETTS